MDRRDTSACHGVSFHDTRGGRRSPRALRWRAAGMTLLAVLSGSGCYHYVPVSPGAVAPEEEVRIRITASAAERLTQELGMYSTEIDGRISSRGPDSLMVAVPIERKYRGIALDSTLQSLALGKPEVVDVRRNELSRGRTILAGAGVLAGFVLLVHAVVQLTNPNPGTDETLPPPPPSGARTPSGHTIGIRIPFP